MPEGQPPAVGAESERVLVHAGRLVQDDCRLGAVQPPDADAAGLRPGHVAVRDGDEPPVRAEPNPLVGRPADRRQPGHDLLTRVGQSADGDAAGAVQPGVAVERRVEGDAERVLGPPVPLPGDLHVRQDQGGGRLVAQFRRHADRRCLADGL